ncbi:MAG: polysaccharide biosynthesis C-terminal domain-containing protein [Lachnospirales bacterium]
MGKNNTMLSQGIILIIANIIVRFFGFIYRIPLANMMGDEGNAIYASSYNIYYFFLIISSASMPAVISKLVSERVAKKRYADAHKVYRVALTISTCLGFIFAVFLFVQADFIEDILRTEGTSLSIRVLAPTVFIVSLLASFRGYFQGLKNTVPTAISQVIEQVVNAVVSLIGAYFLIKYSAAYGAAGSTLGTLFGACAGFITVYIIYLRNKKSIIKKVKLSKAKESGRDIVKAIFLTALPIIVGTAIFALTNILDNIMSMARLEASGAFTYSESVSLYGQLTGKFLVLTNLPISIATVFSASVIPSLAELRVHKRYREINRSINIAIKTVMIIAIPAAVGLTVLAKEIYLFLYPNYPDGYMIMYVGGISIIIIAFNQIIVSVLQGLNRLYLPLISTIVCVIIKTVLNYLLIAIPSVNIIGAAISTIVSYFIFLILDLYFLKRVVKTKIRYDIVFIKPLIASTAMGILCFVLNKLLFALTNSNTFSLLVTISVSVIFYFGFLVFIGSLSEKALRKVPKGYILVNICKKIKIL